MYRCNILKGEKENMADKESMGKEEVSGGVNCRERMAEAKTGRWPDEEHGKYVVFIDFFKRELNSR